RDRLLVEQAASARSVDFLTDDDFVSVGHGKNSLNWPARSVPDPNDIDWDTVHNVPVALITGTNGKSTSVRLSAAIAEAAGLTAGTTSTDYVKIGADILDRGDYSGPGGARMLLRDKRLEVAFLEVARGGILRRGLPLQQAQAALVTNIAADHLGQYGVNTVEALAEAKFAVARTLSADGVLVLNADDVLVVANGLKAERQVWWFSLHADNPQILAAKAAKVPCCWLEGSNIVFSSGDDAASRLAVTDAPITMGGAARFNIQNVMGALCLAKAMGLSDTVIKKGLTTFKSLPEHNPGRCNEFDVKGAKVFVDFAHNPHSVDAVSAALSGLPAKRKYLLIGHAGDRSDQEIRDLTRSALAFGADHIVAAELENHLRGRELGEVSKIIQDECIKGGMPASAISLLSSPAAGAAYILENLTEGDLALLLALDERETIFKMLDEANA
ncbi:MAG: Mur ligase, partial [Proteobacteria bacterium]|nr:Mur ligase [Pseudomonadota bacterium]